MKIVLKPGDRVEIIGEHVMSRRDLDLSADTHGGHTAYLQNAFRVIVTCQDPSARVNQPQQPKPPTQPETVPIHPAPAYGDLSERRVPRYEDQPSAGGRTYAHA